MNAVTGAASPLHEALFGKRQHDYSVYFVFALGTEFQGYAVGGLGCVNFFAPPSSICADEILPSIGGRASSGASPVQDVHINLVFFLSRDAPISRAIGPPRVP